MEEGKRWQKVRDGDEDNYVTVRIMKRWRRVRDGKR